MHRLQNRLLVFATHERKSRRARKPSSVIEIPLHVDHLGTGIHHNCFAYIELVGPWCDAFVTYLDTRRLHKGEKVLIVSMFRCERRYVFSKTRGVDTDLL